MTRLIRDLLRPYKGSLLLVLCAMLVQTLASLAGPWPLKIILDNALGSHKAPAWFAQFLNNWLGGDSSSKMHVAAAAALLTILIAIVGAVACNGNGRSRIAAFIDQAMHTLWVQNERYQDPVIIERLVRANRRGVKVHVMARPAHKLRKEKLAEAVGGMRIMNDVGIKVHRLKGLKLHAKMLLADNVRAVIGSINLAPGSFDSRRELAIEVRDDDIVKRLHHVIRHDWDQSAPIDLTDEGLLADLEDHKSDGAETLAIGESHKAKHSH